MSSTKVLITALPGDLQVEAVRWALNALEVECDVLFPLDLAGGATWLWQPERAILKTEFRGSETNYNLRDYSAAWLRKTPIDFPLPDIEDLTERAIAEAEFSSLAVGVYSAIEGICKTVDPHSRVKAAAYKPWHLSVANSVGLNCAPTVFSNSKADIMQFACECSGDIVYKPIFAGTQFLASPRGAKVGVVPTTVLTPEILEIADLAASPGIYQKRIEKTGEVRVTVIGETIHAWLTYFDQPPRSIDWRLSAKAAIYEPFTLPSKTKRACLRMMRTLGLEFGCLDFVIEARTKELVFLELNPQGQWLYADHYIPELGQLNSLCELLLSEDIRKSDSVPNKISTEHFKRQLDPAWHKQELAAHLGNLLTYNTHRISFPARQTLESQEPRIQSNPESMVS